MSKYSRTKGHNFERQICADFKEIGFKDCQTTRAARGGDWSKTDDGRDLQGTGHYAVQAKRLKNWAPISCIDEIVVRGQEVPLLITKKNNGQAVAVLPWEHLKALIRRLNDVQPSKLSK